MKYVFVTIAIAALALAPIACKNETDQTSLESGKSTSAQPGTTNVSETGSPATTTAGSTATTGGMAATTLDLKDQEFLMKAAQGGLAEVAMGQTATQNAGSADVKSFGQKMNDDHSKANGQLKDLAAKKNFTLPTGPGQEHQDGITKLQSLKGADFDREYMKMMVEDHEKDVVEFDRASKEAKDPDIKAWAASTLPILESHLKLAKETHDKVSGEKKAGAKKG